MQTAFKPRHPLSDIGALGIEMPGKNHLDLVEVTSIRSVLAFAGKADAIEAQLRSGGVDLRFCGPGEWLAIANGVFPELDPGAALIVDQSQGKTLFRLRGPDAVAILMKGVAIDLVGGALEIGRSCNLLYGHVGINLAHTGEDRYELVVMRSYAESLHHDLMVAGREFGLSFGLA